MIAWAMSWLWADPASGDRHHPTWSPTPITRDVAAITATFSADFAHRSIHPSDGDDLVWSPTDSQDKLRGG